LLVTDTVPELKPGAVYTSQVFGPFGFFGYNDIIELYADVKNQEEEKNENNNYYRQPVTRAFGSGSKENIVLFDLSDTSAIVTWKYYSTAVEYYLTIYDSATGFMVYEDYLKYTEVTLPADALTPDTAYGIRVWARVAYGSSYVYRLIYTKGFTTLPVPPVYTAHLSPAHGDYGVPVHVNFAWDPVVGANSYEMELSTDPGFAGVKTTVMELNVNYLSLEQPLAYGTTYYWRLRAVGDGGKGAWVSSVFTTEVAMAEDTSVPVLPPAPVFSVELTQQVPLVTYPALTVTVEDEEEVLQPAPVLITRQPEIPVYFYFLGGAALLVFMAVILLAVGNRRR
jgi:phage tail protein X